MDYDLKKKEERGRERERDKFELSKESGTQTKFISGLYLHRASMAKSFSVTSWVGSRHRDNWCGCGAADRDTISVPKFVICYYVVAKAFVSISKE